MSIPQALQIKQFAVYRDTIEMLYLLDEDFKTLCDDYCISKNSFEKYCENPGEDRKRELEYKDLTLDLEKEILEYVQRLI